MEIMAACYPTSAMEARGEQGQGAVLGPDEPRTLLAFLTFLEQKIGHLRGIVGSAPRQIVSAELSCIAVQLVSVSKSLAGVSAEEDSAVPPRSPPTPCSEAAHEGDSDSSEHEHHAEDAEDRAPPGSWSSYEVIELDREEILAPHVHSCKVCGKGFKRDANLRMHMRGHGDEYKTAAALAKPGRDAPPSPEARTARRLFYSCPYVGCKRNREHRSFQPLKTAVCVKNHYRRSHCDKSFTCRRCNVKRFSVLADLRTHEKHCGRDRWVCSCGTSFSRKDKLFGHVAAFDGHAPALPPEEEGAADATASDQAPMDGEAAVGRMASMEECFSDSMFDGYGPGSFLSPMGLDSCDFEGFDLF